MPMNKAFCGMLQTCQVQSGMSGLPVAVRAGTSLPVQLRNLNITHGLFIWQLKEHLFQEAWTRCSVTS